MTKLYIYYVYIHKKRVFVKKCNPSLGDPWGIFGQPLGKGQCLIGIWWVIGRISVIWRNFVWEFGVNPKKFMFLLPK